jgi:hypothetical protein
MAGAGDGAATRYARIKARSPARDQVGATGVFHELVKAGRPLAGTLALDALEHGNDTHNQEIALCLLDDCRRNPHGDREQLLLACAQHTAGHRKHGDTLEP